MPVLIPENIRPWCKVRSITSGGVRSHSPLKMEAATTFQTIHVLRDDWREGLIDHPKYLASIYRSREESTLTRYAALCAMGKYICAAEAHIRAKEQTSAEDSINSNTRTSTKGG